MPHSPATGDYLALPTDLHQSLYDHTGGEDDIGASRIEAGFHAALLDSTGLVSRKDPICLTCWIRSVPHRNRIPRCFAGFDTSRVEERSAPSRIETEFYAIPVACICLVRRKMGEDNICTTSLYLP